MVSKALGNIEVTCDADRIDLFANEDQENRNPNQLKNKKWGLEMNEKNVLSQD